LTLKPSRQILGMRFSLKRSLRWTAARLSRDGKTICRLWADLEGQLAIEEAALLFRLARGKSRIVEIGSYRGKSTVMMATSAGPGSCVWAIDPHLEFAGDGVAGYSDEDQRVLERALVTNNVADRVTHWPISSRDAFARWQAAPPAANLDMVFIDGDHNYPEVLFDLLSWTPHVARGGTIACHDYTHCAGVKQAWSEVIAAHPKLWAPGASARSLIAATRL